MTDGRILDTMGAGVVLETYWSKNKELRSSKFRGLEQKRRATLFDIDMCK